MVFNYINPLILPLGFFFFFCSLIGVIGNGIMIVCTIKTRRFRSPCHILICVTCVADLLHLSGQFPFCVHLFGNLTSTQSQCYFMLIVPLIGLTTGGPLILSMGVDRFIAVKYPSKYRYYQDSPRKYILCQLLLPLFYCITFLLLGFVKRDTNEKNQLICSNPLSLNGSSFEIFTYSSGFIYLFVIFIYLKVYILLKSNKTSKRFKNVFRSIMVTVAFVLFGWATTTVANLTSYHISDNILTIQLIQMYAGITVNISVASNAFVFYAINAEYREVIKSIFGVKNKAGQLLEVSSTHVVHLKASSTSNLLNAKNVQNTARRMTLI